MAKLNSYFLITSADERTWMFDRPVIFLGEWCRLHTRQNVWKNMNAIVAEPYGLGLAKKDKDFKVARDFEEKLFPRLCCILNNHHGTHHSIRFWRIVLGHWFRRYIDVILNRVNTLEQCIENYEISGTKVIANNNYVLSTVDSISAFGAFNDSCWNSVITNHILNLLGPMNFPIETIEESPPFFYNTLTEDTPPISKKKLLNSTYQFLCKMLSFLVGSKDAFIINSYLPEKQEIKLKLSLIQHPQRWVSTEFEVKEKHDPTLRKLLGRQFSRESGSKLEHILETMLFELLPIIYLEGYANLNKIAINQRWPKSPKFIFTSNNFDTDEVFKMWAANKIELGTKYFVGQHGSNYGTHRYLKDTIEEITADRFLTWGWSDALPQHTPAFIFKTVGKKDKNYNSNGGLLLIELYLHYRISIWDSTYEFVNYFEDQQAFVSMLNISPKQKLTIRLHSDCRHLGWYEELRWKAFDPAIKVNRGIGSIVDLISRSRLIVHSYDSTGILETLSQNIPTMAFWQNGLDHLRDSAKPYYQILVDAGIVHLTSESVAQKVNDVWDDVDTWWESEEVQNARLKFCERYARTSKNFVSDLLQIFSD